MLVLALVLLGQAHGYSPRLSPPLHDGGDMSNGEHQSDKKFFGPPFPADYPEDKRPVPDKNLMDKLKSAGQPFPALQSKEDYDADFVKDENSDTGAWQAQFDYDALRKELAEKEAAARRAAAQAARAAGDLTDAERAAAEAAKKASDAAKNDMDVIEDMPKTADDFGGPPSAEKLEELKKAVEAAEKKLEQQKVAFEKCKQQLEDAKKELEDLKVAQAATEKQLAADTKLWVEKKAVKFNLKKTRESDAVVKVVVAQAKLAAAEKVKTDLDAVLAKEKAEHVAAQKNLQTKQASWDKAKKQLTDASTKLQKLHGYKPVEEAKTLVKAAWWHFW